MEFSMFDLINKWAYLGSFLVVFGLFYSLSLSSLFLWFVVIQLAVVLFFIKLLLSIKHLLLISSLINFLFIILLILVDDYLFSFSFPIAYSTTTILIIVFVGIAIVVTNDRLFGHYWRSHLALYCIIVLMNGWRLWCYYSIDLGFCIGNLWSLIGSFSIGCVIMDHLVEWGLPECMVSLTLVLY